jgi:hypothetical protein
MQSTVCLNQWKVLTCPTYSVDYLKVQVRIKSRMLVNNT